MKAVVLVGCLVAALALGVTIGRTIPALRPGVLAPEPSPRCYEARVYLPLANNAGEPFSQQTWDEALGALVVPFGGATLEVAQEGCWLGSDGHILREPVRPVVVSFAPERLDDFRQAVRAVGRRLVQVQAAYCVSGGSSLQP